MDHAQLRAAGFYAAVWWGRAGMHHAGHAIEGGRVLLLSFLGLLDELSSRQALAWRPSLRRVALHERGLVRHGAVVHRCVRRSWASGVNGVKGESKVGVLPCKY